MNSARKVRRENAAPGVPPLQQNKKTIQILKNLRPAPVHPGERGRVLIHRDHNGSVRLSHVYQMSGSPPVLPGPGADQVLPGTHLDDPGRRSTVPRLPCRGWQLLPQVVRIVTDWEPEQFSSPPHTFVKTKLPDSPVAVVAASWRRRKL